MMVEDDGSAMDLELEMCVGVLEMVELRCPEAIDPRNDGDGVVFIGGARN